MSFFFRKFSSINNIRNSEIMQEKELFNVAMISTNKNPELSKLITQALMKSDNVKVEKSQKSENELEVAYLNRLVFDRF